MALLTFDTAMKLLAQKKYQAVYDLAIAALRQNEKNALAFFVLGLVASDNGHLSKALEFFAKASEHDPKNARYQAYCAKTLINLGRHIEAKRRADHAAALTQKDAFLADMIGTVYSRSGYHDLALPMFKTAARLNPNWPIFQFNLAASAQFSGHIKTAKTAYQKAVALNPQFYRAWFALISLETQTADTQLETLKPLFEAAGQDAGGRLMVGHAIAKTLEDLGRYPESLEWLHKAKEMSRARIRHDPSDVKNIFKSARSTSSSNLQHMPHKNGVKPIFIIGMPRTGTTLLDRILSSHPEVTSAGELDVFSHLVKEKIDGGLSKQLDAQTFLSASKLNLKEIGQDYSHRIAEMSNGAQMVIDSTPLNFLYAGLIHQALPDAKIIGLRRGAMDTCLSNYRQLFALDDNRYTYTLSLDDTAEFYREFDALTTHWRGALPASRFLEMRYEDMVHEQESETRRLLSFCGLDWDAACLRFHENAAPVDTASSVQVRRPLYSGSINRWKKYGDHLDGLKAALGELAKP
ncbi:tetratricopeptide repeat-containing sulfotransferase family protein [Robiginitomaculum antarcticum]|uniref:tetratricopeptide repeat-containing sulfotransferase family protein n=1 Tax=Robiginitomaculum antarcticum TaxID=437507 RepID=UPI0003633CD7|nr:tetratricopeptide repeat-containing sulfotransferase family protein [Robiginitomaculum antarcticum]